MLNSPIKRNVRLSITCNRNINTEQRVLFKFFCTLILCVHSLHTLLANATCEISSIMLNWNQLLSSLGLLLYSFLFRETENGNFKIYWGVPTSSCRKFQLDFANLTSSYSLYNLVQNTNDSVRGDKIAILYNPGAWPSIETSRNGQLIFKHGGLPQNGNLDVHLKQLELDIDTFIPNKMFDGVAVIDFEMWRPTFRQNFDKLKIYRELTTMEVAKKHPSWTREQVERQSEMIFENAALNFFNRTLLRAKKLRPRALWGYYGFPHCFNRFRDLSALERCPEQVEAENDRLSFLFSSAAFPSLYTTQNQTGKVLTKFVQGKMREASRVTKSSLDAQRLAFMRYQYTDSMSFMSSNDMRNLIKTLRAENGDGVIIWGSSSQFKTASQCRAFKMFYESDLMKVIRDATRL